MRYPNRRYGNPAELRSYAEFYPKKQRLKLLSKQLRRSERSIKDWLEEKKKMPWWVPEIIRLQKMEHDAMMRQMGMNPMLGRLGIVRGEVIELHRPKEKHSPQAVKDDTGANVFLLQKVN